MNKRGISGIAVIMLLTTLAFIGIIIIGNIVKIFIEKEIEIGKIKTKLLTERIEIISVQFNSVNPSLINVTIRKSNEKSISNTTQITTISQTEIDVISVVDLSGSMNIFDKLSQLKSANKELVNAIIASENKNKIGLVGYRDYIVNEASLDLTRDTSQLNTIIDSWTASSETCICCGINNAVKRLKEQSPSEKLKAMIVMSDGIPEGKATCAEQGTGDSFQDTIKAACDANKTLNNLIIYSIGFGQYVNEQLLEQLAQCGNGKYFFANIGEITNAYRDIVQEIKKISYIPIQTIDHIKIIFYNETSSHEEIITNIPQNIFETKKYNFDLEGKIHDIKRIEVYSVALTESGKEIIGHLLDSWE